MTSVQGLGHIVLRVRDIEESERFYKKILGLKVRFKRPGAMVFLTARENVSHELALFPVTTAEIGCIPGEAGLAHFGWAVADFSKLQDFYDYLISEGIQVTCIKDHGIALGVYFRDPDNNEIEVYCELPPDQWPTGPQMAALEFPLKLRTVPESGTRHG